MNSNIIRQLTVLAISCVVVVPTLLAQVSESRDMRYRPEGDDFVIVNGDRRFNRALYGGNSGFRVETGDVPEFALYLPRMGGNLTFWIKVDDDTLFLNEASYIESRYGAGTRHYEIKDELLGKGQISVCVVAPHDEETAIWKISTSDLPKNTRLMWRYGGVANKRFSREGDMGVDKKDCFDMLPEYCKGNICLLDSLTPEHFSIISPQNKYGQYVVHGYFPSGASHQIQYVDKDNTLPYIFGSCDIAQSSDYYIRIGLSDQKRDIADVYEEAVSSNKQLSERIRFVTPDKYINPIGGALSVAANAIWDGTTWLHGAIGWRMPLAGWRAAYAGDMLGWHDRGRKHFDAYAASQVTDVEPIYSHPYQDSTLNLARAAKIWGTQMYSNGYICRNPNRNNQMHHYDMNLNYIDELLWHLSWTGDIEYARQMWPLLERHLAWEKRNFDPDDDGLYDAYCCIWASDALFYNGGSATHSTALNYRANKMASIIAALLGYKERAKYYECEAHKIAKAIDSTLWEDNIGVWAEYKDLMGYGRLHTNAALWTIYHAIDSRVGSSLQRYRATQYVDSTIPHIPIESKSVESGRFATISTSNWQPYIWSINNVAFAEVMNMALAYWQSGRYEEGYTLLKSSILDGMYMGGSPGNFGQISYYDVARGECYRDFGDPIGVASRVFIQGLYGVEPNRLMGEILLCPGFPREWNEASLRTPDIEYSFSRNGKTDRYICHLDSTFGCDTLRLQVRAYMSKLNVVTVNGKRVSWHVVNDAVEIPMVEVVWGAEDTYDFDIKIEWGGAPTSEMVANVAMRDGVMICSQDDMTWIKKPSVSEYSHLTMHNSLVKQFEEVDIKHLEMIDLKLYYNDSITNIFKPRYLSPRPKLTTLQIPIQGIGDWCHPKTTFDIDDKALRRADVLQTSLGVPFKLSAKGNNVVFSTLWDNFPDSCIIPLSGKAKHIYLLMAGTTNAMQSGICNAEVRVVYDDGSADTLSLYNPHTWYPIEQDYYDDGKAFRLMGERPYRLHLLSGLVSRELSRDLKIKSSSDKHSIDTNSTAISDKVIEGGAATLYDIHVDKSKRLKSLQVNVLSNDIVVGLLGVTLQR